MVDEGALEAKLAALREQSDARTPAAVIDRRERLFRELEESAIAKGLDVGDRAPDFTLTRAGGAETVTLSESLKRGPAVLSFYRGFW